jgi:hypothetical protein
LHSWLGATDIDHEGLFVWVDGSEVDKKFENWADGQPSNSNGNEHCAVISSELHRWNDLLCSRFFISVCEFD